MKYNCIIIGSGSAGFYSALSCSKNGYRTAIIENAKLGGTGFRTGCLPVKKNLDGSASEVLAASGILIGQKLTQKMILDNLFIHPTMGEAILEAVITA